MDEKDPGIDPGRTVSPQPPGQPRSMNLAAVAGGILIIALVALALYRRGTTVPPAPAPEPVAPQSSEAPPGDKGVAIAQEVPVSLTPEASIIAEKYRCVCGCNEALNVCTCSKSPGSNEMKRFLQNLVSGKRSSAEIDKAMIEKWGQGVAITPAAPAIMKRPAKR